MAIESTSFRGTQTEFLTFAQLMHQRYGTNEGAFKTLDPFHFNPQFKGQLQEAIDTAIAIPTDEQMLDLQAERTALVSDKMAECQRLFNRVLYFVESAFPNRPKVWDVFGKNDYGAARTKADGLALFMERLYATTVRYAKDLDAVGFTQAHRDNLKKTADELKNAYFEQQAAKDERGLEKERRAKAFEQLWALVQKVSRAGKLIFKDVNESAYRQFLLPSSKPKTVDVVTEVAAKTTISVVETVEKEEFYEISNKGTVDLAFFVAFSASAESISNSIAIKSGETRILSVSELGFSDELSKQSLFVANHHATTAGRFRAELLE